MDLMNYTARNTTLGEMLIDMQLAVEIIDECKYILHFYSGYN